MNRTNFEQVQYENSGGVKPIITNLVSTYPHWHNEIEIVFACLGDLLLESGREKRLVRQGEIAVVNSAEIHAVNSVEAKNGGKNLVLMLQIGGSFFRAMSANMDSPRFSRLIEGAEVDEIRKLLLLIMEEEQNKRKDWQALIHGYCGAVVALLLRHFSANSDQAPQENEQYNRNYGRLKKILGFVNEHYAESPSLNEVAEIVYVSPYYLSHFFTQAMGMGYSQYLNYVKVSMAKRSIAATDDSITDILSRNGFANAKTFNRAFKEIVGCSPREYRKSVRGGAEPDLPPIEKPHLGSYVNYQSHVAIPRAMYRVDAGADNPGGAGEIVVRVIEASAKASVHKLDRYFCKMIGTARASDFLRKKVQEQFRAVMKEINFEYVRFHGIFDDVMCVVLDDGRFNWTYIDDIFDFLLEINLKPFIEFSFMPPPLASGDATMFYYKANVTPPRDWEKWGELISAFMAHIVAKYTLNEVKTWYFEVWNEPNLPVYWSGGFENYMRLYRITAERIKAVSRDCKVGGPALSSFRDADAESFLRAFLHACVEKNLPLDFVSGHPYPVTYYDEHNNRREVFRDPDSTRNDVAWFQDIVRTYINKKIEFHFDEWNSSPRERDLVHDTAFMAVFILHNYHKCRNMAVSLCYWVLSDRFEEHGLDPNEFHGGFGLLSMAGFKKPQYYAFRALFALGNELLAQGEDYIVARSPETGEIQVLCWNYVHYNESYASGEWGAPDFYERYRVFEEGKLRCFSIRLMDIFAGDYLMEKTVFDREHGSIFDFWLKNGALNSLNYEQREFLRSQCVPQMSMKIMTTIDSVLTLEETVAPFGFVLFRVRLCIARNEK
ncbi:MAG: helix-turn-helix domain-containing protein [Treponema sp.]|jgi:xylan 1,4-beta-xylosidase|nr:helix-turn-helix domain-containing protein [Treponema sp.]